MDDVPYLTDEELVARERAKEEAARKTAEKKDADGAHGKDEAEIDRLASLSRLDYGRERKEAAKRLGVIVGTLDAMVKTARERAMRSAKARERTDEQQSRDAKYAELGVRCEDIATDPELLNNMATLVGRMGLVNERSAIKAGYLAATSRLERNGAIALLRRGAAASGKNYPVEKLFRLLPPESIVTAVGGSPKSLPYYGGADAEDALKHKLIYIPEAAAFADKGGIENEFTTMLRVLISEGRIVYQTVQTQENSPPITVTIVKNGPLAVFITSARDNIEEEMLTRLMVLDADESDSQTRAIIENALTSETGERIEQEEIDAWVDFQRWLELGGPYDVVIPFLEAIKAAHDH
jgi:hypothetical protein